VSVDLEPAATPDLALPSGGEAATVSLPDPTAGAADRRRTCRRRLLAFLMNFYPPYLGAGVRVRLAPAADGVSEAIAVRMRLRFWNRNLLGTHFGGSLYSMCDPFFVILLLHELGAGYVVWDKAATIAFRRPGRGTVSAAFSIPAATVADIRAAADRGETLEPTFEVTVVDGAGEVVAVVEKRLYVRRRRA
jgi:hypothetical protein